MKANGLLHPLLWISILSLAGCSRSEEAASPDRSSTSGADVVCSYAPSQSDTVSHISAVAGGSAATAAAIAQAAGLTAVLHSSGAYIFTGTAGYIAGTMGGAVALPVVIVVGVTAGGAAATLELVCAPRNHPDLVAKVEKAAERFYQRSSSAVQSAANSSATAAAPIVAKFEKAYQTAKESIFD